MAIVFNGALDDWINSERFLGDLPEGYRVFARAEGDSYIFAIESPVAIGANTTIWLNTDRDASTGYQIFGFAGGAEYNINFDAAGNPSLYTGAAGQTLVASSLEFARSADGKTLEIKVNKADIGNAGAIDALIDVNDAAFLPTSYVVPPISLFNSGLAVDRSETVIGIVFSETTAANFFDSTAYSQLFMAAQSQAMQAGVRYEMLTEEDLKDLTTVARYDSIVFPSFRNVKQADLAEITATLQQAAAEFDVGFITAGDFMTNDETGAALAGDSYARMKLLLGVTRVDGGFPADVSVRANDAGELVLQDYAAGEVIRDYKGIGWNAFVDVSGNGTTVANQIVNGQSYKAVIANETGGRNVHFATEAVLADNNLLWQAIDHSVAGAQISVGLEITRSEGVFSSRNDMDQSQESFDVNPDDGVPGIYDVLLPILDQWKATYNFVGSYYVNVGNDVANGQFTDWSISAPYYAQLLAAGNEIGLHSYTHPENTNLLTAEQIAFEFGQERLVLEANMAAYLGRPVNLGGAAVPGAPEKIATSFEILKYVDYLSGGYSATGAGYPHAFGYLTPDSDKVYLAPNMSFDFTLIDFQKLTIPEATAKWQAELSGITDHAETPIVLFPWHDYGPTAWSVNEGVASNYNISMFTAVLEQAAAEGLEFVTLADLANRIASFNASKLTSTINGNVITATVGSADAGKFALDIDGQGGQVISSVRNWYAYDDDSVFLPSNGGTFEITLGSAALDVTHITALPMRGELLSLSGDGLNLSFSVYGEGQVVIDLRNNGAAPVVTGATVVSKIGDLLTLQLGIGNGPELIRNGSFESETVGSGRRATFSNGSLDDWSNGGWLSLELWNARSGVVATDGRNFLELDSSLLVDSLRQSVVTEAGKLYEFSVDLRAQGSNLASNTVEVWFNNERVTTIDPASNAAWTNYKVTLTGTGGTSLLELREASNDNNAVGALVDNLSLKSKGTGVGTGIGLHEVTITLGAPVNPLPVITSNGGGDAAAVSVAENSTAVTTVAATATNDLGQPATVTYAISGGADAAKFAINATTGALTFRAAPDFEAPGDAGGDNVYDVVVAASFGSLVDLQSLAVRVTDVLGATINGDSSANTLTGTSENDTINGNSGNDTISGGIGADRITGGNGADRLTGGAGADLFIYTSTGDSRTSSTNRDVITDFDTNGDRIDLSAIDAKTGLLGLTGQAGNQAFVLLTTAGANFTAEGQLRYFYQTVGGIEYTVIQGDNNSSRGADFEIALVGRHQLDALDFVL